MVDLVRAGRDPTELSREFEPSGQAIRNWGVQADGQEGRREELMPLPLPRELVAMMDALGRRADHEPILINLSTGRGCSE
jgi:transposase